MKMRCLAVAACVFAVATGHAAEPSAALQSRVRSAAFEVVVPKPPESGVVYERTPPFELLPYAERSDKFWSVGTAFAIEPGTFVSAAHVLQAAMRGSGGPPRLRDAGGATYAIDRVLKYSAHHDYVVFTAAVTTEAVLETNTATRLDEPVFAVGNALGEGVVIRDGLLTSYTPEEQDGRWKWLRYSAATSPGNSGGPLLNVRGEAIGVVIAHSSGENLNYALPIEYVLNGAAEMRMESRTALRVPVLRDAIVATYDFAFPLPMPLGEFVTRHETEFMKAYRRERDRLIRERAAELFPKGDSQKLLASVEKAHCPALVAQSKERTWQVNAGGRETTDLPGGGSVCARVSADMPMFHIDRGTATDAAFYGDRRTAMDLLLKGLSLMRPFGAENVRITSLGAPVSDVEHRDAFGRRWRLATFALPYLDAQLPVLFLPTPDGYAGMVQLAFRGTSELAFDQLRFAADYFYVSYDGTLAQWRAFLARPDLRPAAFDGVTLERDAAGMHFRSRRLDVKIPPALMGLDDASPMQLHMSYSLEAGEPVWDVAAVYVSTDSREKTYVGLIRQPKPHDGAGKELADRWIEMLDGTGAFRPDRGHDADYREFWRRTAIGPGYVPGGTVNRKAGVLYEALSVVNGAKLPRRVDDMQDLLLENVQIKER